MNVVTLISHPWSFMIILDHFDQRDHCDQRDHFYKRDHFDHLGLFFTFYRDHYFARAYRLEIFSVLFYG